MFLWLLAAVVAITVGIVAFVKFGRTGVGSFVDGSGSDNSTIPVGVLGDSDSHSYQDTVSFPPGTRFGSYRAMTLQWTEVLARLRPQQLDFGTWGVRGTRRSVAELMDWAGLGGRFPKKEDFLYNLAFSGATCDSLMGYNGRLARRLAAQMDREPQRWRRGIVVIRLGINDFGHSDSLDLLAHDPADPLVLAKIANCLGQIKAAVDLIHCRHPTTRIVLVGILGDTHDPSQLARWRSAEASSNISAGLDRFDHGLMAMVRIDPRLAFFDDRLWFAQHWGGRTEQGEPGYKTVRIDDRLTVTNSAGDDPTHALTADEHAGLVWNTLWAQALVGLMNSNFGIGVQPIVEREVVDFLQPAAAGSH